MGDELLTNLALVPPGATTPSSPVPAAARAFEDGSATQRPFAELLADAASSSTPVFSKHCAERLVRRGIAVDASMLKRLTEGISRAASKGSRNAVVFVDGTAFVASVTNRTVITAVTPERMRSHVFTNIDSAVIA